MPRHKNVYSAEHRLMRLHQMGQSFAQESTILMSLDPVRRQILGMLFFLYIFSLIFPPWAKSIQVCPSSSLVPAPNTTEPLNNFAI